MTSARWRETLPGDSQPRAFARLAVRASLGALALLLLGYMFLGRGFAHVGFPPLYVGEAVLFLGVFAAGLAVIAFRLQISLSPVIWLLLGFAGLGLLRTVPYLSSYGFDALRDAVLWGYAAFALIIYALGDRALVLTALRAYWWVIPVFAIWLPIAFNIFVALSAGIQPDERGSEIPLVFFKSGDMAVHVVGALAALVLVPVGRLTLRSVALRAAIAAPLLWTAFVGGATNRGGLLTVTLGAVLIALLSFILHRRRNWLPVLVAPALVLVAVLGVGLLGTLSAASPEADATDGAEQGPSAAAATSSPGPSPAASPAVVTSPGDVCPAPVVGGSLVANDGFEVGVIGGGMIEAWQVGQGNYHILEGGAHAGDRYAHIENTSGSTSSTMASCRFHVQSGRHLSVSLWARAVMGGPVVATWVIWYDASGDYLSTDPVSSLPTSGVLSWQPSVGAILVPPRAMAGQLVIEQQTPVTAAGIDEVLVFTEGSDSAIFNPGFEVGPAGTGTLVGWEILGGTAALVEGEAPEGERFATLHSGADPYTAALASVDFPVAPGQDVVVSYWARAVDGSPTAVALVTWLDAAGEELAIAPLGPATPTGAAWDRTEGHVTVPERAAVAARLVFWEASGGAGFGIDEVSVRVMPAGPKPEGRPATIGQIIENITSIFSSVEDEALEGTKAFRLRWWTAIVRYTVFGEYFWTGKGFGINLADADGFQANEDGSLRAPHNSHITVLARMGVPGLLLWVGLQATFAVMLIRAVLALRRRGGDLPLAVAGGWLLAYWFAMMVNTSFDPYLEGPQGGIWFWTVFGLGLVVIAASRRRALE